MSLETGKIYDGKVRNIAAYGAFVEISLEDKVYVGMVHISEISNTFVNEIKDHIKEGEDVKVKVLNVDENGKISLSIKKAMEPAPQKTRTPNPKFNNQNNQKESFGNDNNQNSQQQPRQNNKSFNNGPKTFASKPQQPQDMSFEDMLARFKQSSEEKMSDLKRNIDSKRKSSGRRGSK